MRKLFTYLLTVILLVTAVPAMAQVLPSDIINSETRFAIVNSGETQSLLEAVRNGELTREGTTKGIGESIIVQSLTEGLLMLSSNRADVILTLSPTARYVAARNLGLMSVEGVYALDLCMLISNEKPELLESVNTAIADMHTDGTLGALWNSNVAELGINDEPVAVVPAVIEGAQTVRVGVSGDIPPLDYTSVDGKPAGYNTAVLAEIAKRAGFNVEFVYMETGARFTALSTGRIDLFFWQLGFERDVLSSDTFTGDLEALTKDLQDVVPCLRSEPYASAKVGWVARTDVVARSDSALLELAREAAAWVAAHPNATPAEVQAYCAELGVDDVCAVDASGAIAISNQAANIGFNFADDEQSAAFLPILRNEITELAQPATPRGVDGAMYRYAGVAGGIDGGLTQVGMRVE